MFKKRNMAMQVLLMIITLGIYGIYWFYVTTSEMVEHRVSVAALLYGPCFYSYLL